MSQSTNQSTNQATNQPTNQSESECNNESIYASIYGSANDSVNQFTKHWINAPIKKLINRRAAQWINESTHQRLNRRIDQWVCQSTNLSTSESIKEWWNACVGGRMDGSRPPVLPPNPLPALPFLPFSDPASFTILPFLRRCPIYHFTTFTVFSTHAGIYHPPLHQSVAKRTNQSTRE